METPQPSNRCPTCGGELPASVPAAMCPRCLLGVGMLTQAPDEEGGWSPTVEPAPMRGLPQPGEDFGHYHLIRLLGRGGMGVVFEAEDRETGRRIALKVLSQALDSPEARKRFLREGRIAASINHPNSVYIFGTEEIAGTPVISMELVGGGTLRDKVADFGPMAAGDAVEAILQIIAGLEAGQKTGVLHRDVKPSNCFVDSDGTTKIGDFGLSITTSVRTDVNLSVTGSLFGTPAYSSPEQLRGDELTVRSDIYSVGVTLFYLLTGRLPFESDNMVQFLVTVLEKQAAFPESFRATLPAGLMRVVLKCLSKDPLMRFESYEALRTALFPFAKSSPVPAKVVPRLCAWYIDQGLISAVQWIVVVGGAWSLGMGIPKDGTLASVCAVLVFEVFYFGLLEGMRGATVGKAICRLRVCGEDGNLPGVKAALLRAVILCGAPAIALISILVFVPDALTRDPDEGGLGWPILALVLHWVMKAGVLATCRRRNGYRGLHEFWSGTRVLERSRQALRPRLSGEPGSVPEGGSTEMVGPYHVLSDVGLSGEGQVSLAYDAKLLRKVWIRRVPAGTAEVNPVIRHLARQGRLRWLNGRREEGDSWDAYEAPDGRPFLEVIQDKPEWGIVRFWLMDLTQELKLVEEERSRVPMRLDHLWITAEGRAKLLDFPAPGGPLLTDQPGAPTPWGLIRQAGLSALSGRMVGIFELPAMTPQVPLPLDVREFFHQKDAGTRIRERWMQLDHLVRRTPVVTRMRRAAMLGVSLVFPLLMASFFIFGYLVLQNGSVGEVEALHRSMEAHRKLESMTDVTEMQERAELESYIAGRFGHLVHKPTYFQSLLMEANEKSESGAGAESLIRRVAPVDHGEFVRVKGVVEERFPDIPTDTIDRDSELEDAAMMLSYAGYLLTICVVVIPSVACALLFHSGVAMRLVGIAVVGRRGSPSRVRSLVRAIVAWLPFVLIPLPLFLAEDSLGATNAAVAACAFPVVFALLSLCMKRSLQDRIAGTWLVPAGFMPEGALVPLLGPAKKDSP